MKKIILLTFLISTLCSWAQPEPKAITGKTSYEFWVTSPKEISPKNKRPMILFLHGKSLSGKDINRVKRYGILKGLTKNIKALNESVIVAPQLPSGAWDPEKVHEVVEYVKNNYAIDESRIYVTGMSLGSYGTMKYASTYPEEIAAVVSICGGGEERELCNAAQLPILLIHGDADRAVPLSESKKVLNAIKKCNPNAPIELRVVKGGTHGSVEDLYRHAELYQWMLQYQKKS